MSTTMMGRVRPGAWMVGTCAVTLLGAACAAGSTDLTSEDDGAARNVSGSGGRAPSTAVGREPQTASVGAGATTGAGGAGAGMAATTITATSGGAGAGGPAGSTGSGTATTGNTTTATTTSGGTTSTTGGGCTPVQVLVDGGFEQGLNTPAWSLASTNYGTPICDVGGCGMGGGTGPKGGGFWAWFGGTPLGGEIATASQSVVIPNASTATLEFWFEMPACDGPIDIFDVTIDGTVIFMTNGADPMCGSVGYQPQSFDVSAFADGGQHTLQFRGDTLAFFFTATNFMVDDVSLTACP
ncbi:MAG: hypothetical protein AAF928_09000 [Myxococcota bacterium]